LLTQGKTGPVHTSQGTTPAGITDEQQAATWVRGMFGRIAPRYDLLNHLLSLNIDRYWRARTVKRVSDVLGRPGARVLDLCCGTGDLMLALQARSGAMVYGSDFCHPMVVAANRKVKERRLRSALFEADAITLPVADASVDLITMAFGFRNLANYQQGLSELMRVLTPGGLAAILEFSTPPNPVLSRLYDYYSRAILPVIGGWISGSREAYSYLPESVRKFPGAEELADQMRGAGFTNVRFERMTAGIVALHLGERPR
jgi:demethylmenaquinone methyltransferase/2-methoxy-6-polyprenyl-1,4-benzoquinol methylase